jgi:hypothetical protein
MAFCHRSMVRWNICPSARLRKTRLKNLSYRISIFCVRLQVRLPSCQYEITKDGKIPTWQVSDYTGCVFCCWIFRGGKHFFSSLKVVIYCCCGFRCASSPAYSSSSWPRSGTTPSPSCSSAASRSALSTAASRTSRATRSVQNS